MRQPLFLKSANPIATETEQSNGTIEKLLEIVKNPLLYIVLGSLFAIIVIFYFVKRFVRARPNAAIIILRKKELFKIVDSNNQKYYLVPFIDSVGCVISLDLQSFDSDNLFVNDGPDRLYKINYSINYRVVNPKVFYVYFQSIKTQLEVRINDALRLFADNGNSSIIIKDYRKNIKDILSVVQNAMEECGIEVSTLKINYIQPLGK